MPFDLQPTLQGELVLLRPLRSEDSGQLYLVASDPLIWEQHPARDRYKPEVFEVFFRDAMASGGALLVRKGRSRAGADPIRPGPVDTIQVDDAANRAHVALLKA